MTNEIFIVLAFIVAGFFALGWILYKGLSDFSNKKGASEDIVEWLKSTNQRLEEQSRTFSSTLAQNTQALNERLDNAARVILGVQRSVGEMSEIGRSMKELQEFLRSPKLRGNIGEQVLKELLGQMLPKQSFHLQYSFKSGVVVDAAIQTSAGIIPIDSKFPMENFKRIAAATTEAEKEGARREFVRGVKRHVDDISKKYILTEEGTLDYALMYIPSESVYYEIMTSDVDLVEYAYQKRVLPVSPTTFYAYLRAILMSFEGQKIEARARDILSAIRAVQKDYNKVEEGLGVLGRHVGNAYNMMASVVQTFSQLGQKIASTRALGQTSSEEDKLGEERLLEEEREFRSS